MSTRRVAAGLFVLVFVTHALSPIGTSSDSRWNVPLILSLLSEGNTNLDEFAPDVRGHRYLGIQCVDAQHRVTWPSPETGCPAGGHAYYSYPIGTSVLAAPVMAGMDACLRVLGPVALAVAAPRLTPAERQFAGRQYLKCFGLVELVLASFIIAVATVFIFLTARLFLHSGYAVLLALLFAYATPAWSTASRALWQHGPNMLMLSLALYLLSRAATQPSLLKWTAVPLVFSYFIRPTSLLFVLLIGAFVCLHHWRHFWKWSLLAACTASPFLLHNLLIYRSALQPYFRSQHFLAISPQSAGPLLVALAGQCFSPSRGLFIFSPFLLFSLGGIYLAFRRHWQTPLVYYLGVGVLLHWGVISVFADWPAGHSYGPRYFSDVVPVLMFFLIPVLQAPRKSTLLVVAFVLCAFLSAFIHFRGATNWDVYLWNGDAGGATPAHAWDWRDPQFLRGLF